MNIAFFISNCGYGHLIRNLPVIDELIKNGNKVVVVCDNKRLKIALKHNRLIIPIEYNTDVGYILNAETFSLNEKRTKKAVSEYIDNWELSIDFGVEIIHKFKIEKAVIDIVPWAILSAKKAGISSFLILSFTWVEQFRHILKNEYITRLNDAYLSATHYFLLPLSNSFAKSIAKNRIDTGFLCRKTNDKKVKEIIKCHNGKKIIFVSFGGLDSSIDFETDVSDLPYDFITTPSTRLSGKNVSFLSKKQIDTQNYIKAADLCIIKSGWTTISEIMVLGKPFVVVKRNGVLEDKELVKELDCYTKTNIADYNPSLFFGLDFKNLFKQKVKKQPNCAPLIANQIIMLK